MSMDEKIIEMYKDLGEENIAVYGQWYDIDKYLRIEPKMKKYIYKEGKLSMTESDANFEFPILCDFCDNNTEPWNISMYENDFESYFICKECLNNKINSIRS